MTVRVPTIMISAGEASGDSHAASALVALTHTGLEFSSFGMGSDKLEASGTELIVNCRDLAVMGFVDVLLNLPRFLLKARKLKKTMRLRQPDLLILVDYASFNLSLARYATSLGIPVLFYISPKLWASRPERINKIKACVTHMAVLFPFEVEIFEKAGIPVTYVGNPLVEQVCINETPETARSKLGIAQSGTVVGLLPGSRRSEIKYNLVPQLETARLLQQSLPHIQFLLPRASTIDIKLLNQLLLDFKDLDLTVTEGDAHRVMRACDSLIIASGTATLEAAVVGTPMVVMYVMHAINHALMKSMLIIDNISLVNIVAQKRIVEELIQHEATPSALAEETRRLLLDESYKVSQKKALAEVQSSIGENGASSRLADLARSLLDGTNLQPYSN